MKSVGASASGMASFPKSHSHRRTQQSGSEQISSRRSRTERTTGSSAPLIPTKSRFVCAVLRRRPASLPTPRFYRCRNSTTTASRLVWVDGCVVGLTSAEYDILEYLAREVGRVVSRDELMEASCRRQASPLDRALDVHISHLRRKLRQHGSHIRTVRGIGYMMAKYHEIAANGEVVNTIGVAPDHYAPMTAADLSAGRDPGLDRARQLLR